MGSTAKNAAAVRSMRRAAAPILALVFLAPVVASCSSSEDAGSDTTTTAATADAASTDPAAADGATTTTGAPALSDPATGGEESGLPASKEYALDATAPLADGVDVRVSSITTIDAEAALPGEIGGPGVQLVVELTNSSSEAVDLASFLIDLTDADGVSAGQVTTDPARPVMGSLEPGGTATGTYVFVVPTADRADARVVLSLIAGQPQVVLAGDLPDA
jgi:hypothetical protein